MYNIIILQNIAVGFIIICALAYIIHRIKTTFKEAESGCYGCMGCTMKKKMMKAKRKRSLKSSPNECFSKKI